MKGPRGDVAVLLATFFLTVIIDLTVAIEIGMVLAVFLFMRKMIKFSNVNILTRQIDDERDSIDKDAISNYKIPKDVEVFEITGPLFFGAAYKFKDAIKFIERTPKVLIIRMRHVPIIDATGIHVLKDVYQETKKRGTKIILSGVTSEQVMEELKKSRLVFSIGKANIADNFEEALKRCSIILGEKSLHHSNHDN
jgi:SulP family sulfate permease